jgi:hypothetical protein
LHAPLVDKPSYVATRARAAGLRRIRDDELQATFEGSTLAKGA